ncbi:MAG: aminoglycoside 6-adenylyltransferase [Clostridia bacterium]|nr:aminoglycoside 6-adenylyltransferase [Clostridia bacterium]
MRTTDEMMGLIIKIGEEDDRIHGIVLEGSRANPKGHVDAYSDYDIVYFVQHIKSFTLDAQWTKSFGDILIMQKPDDWHNHLYDYDSNEPFTYLMQFTDGNRIDLILVDIHNPKDYYLSKEPRKILLNKGNYLPLKSSDTFNASFNTSECTLKAFSDVSNEFRWLCLYVSKGLLRHQILYAKSIYEGILMPQYLQMIKWYYQEKSTQKINFGSFDKYLTQYMNDAQKKILMDSFPNGEVLDIWEKLFYIYDAFHVLSNTLAVDKSFPVMNEEIISVKQYLTDQYIHY